MAKEVRGKGWKRGNSVPENVRSISPIAASHLPVFVPARESNPPSVV